jgi:nucleoside-diphosphate-sugar epimerase
MPDPDAPINPDRLIVGCGYLGRRVAALWLGEGRRVFTTTRNRADELCALGVEPVVADVLDPTTLAWLPNVGTVVYAVGLDRTSGASMRDVYVDGLANVLNALPASNRLIYVSSTSVYGQTDGGEVEETAATDPLDESGRVVLDVERLLHRMRPDAIVLRFAGIYGPGRLLRRKAQLESREPIAADPDAWLNLIHADDGAAAILAAERRGRPGALYNVSDGHPTRRGDFYRELARLLDAPPPMFAAAPDKANRRIVSRLLRAELAATLRYPSYVEGLAASVDSSPSSPQSPGSGPG